MVSFRVVLRRSLSSTVARAVFALSLSSAVGCNPWRSDDRKEGASASAVPQGSTARTAGPAPSGSGRAKPQAPVFNIPVGPRFAIEPGVGLGPIRFGATAATIERLMETPCAEKDAKSCRYPIHAVEFELTDGALSTIHIHGHERLAKQGEDAFVFGIFNGKLLNGVELGMYREYVESVMGPAPSGRDIAPGTARRGFSTVYVAEYPGARFEYDKLANGNVVLAGIVLTKADVASLAPSGVPSAAGKVPPRTPPSVGTSRPPHGASPRPKPPLH
jgi:hypothetical protein